MLQDEFEKLKTKYAESAKICAETKQALKGQIVNLRNKHDAKQSQLIRQGFQMDQKDRDAALAATKHKHDMKKAVNWCRLQGL